MQLSPLESERIVAESAFLQERVSALFSSHSDAAGHQKSGSLEDWRTAVAQGDDELFTKRLQWDGLSESDAETLLGSFRLAEGQAMPEWMTCLQGALDAFPVSPSPLAKSRQKANGVFEKITHQPFEEILQPFASYASSQVALLCPEGFRFLSREAELDLREALIRRLAWLSMQALYLEFVSFSTISSATGEIGGFYDAFTTEFYQGGFVRFLTEYPVLARFLGEATALWIESTRSFLVHLGEDAELLGNVFNEGKAMGTISEVRIELSDPHNGGKTVIGLLFESGTSCFYKPKNLASDELFQDLLTLLEKDPAILPMKKMEIIVRDDHGWTNEIVVEGLKGEAQAERYFERMGTILFAMLLLGANDCNIENIIPSGEYPVTIDTETIFQSQPRPTSAPMWAASNVAEQELYYNSVLRVGMLPRWKPGPDGQKHDISSLGGYNGQRGNGTKRVWHNLNSDKMRYSFEQVSLTGPLAHMGDQTLNPVGYRDSLIRGFTKAYRAAMQLRDEDPDVAHALMGKRVLRLRFIARNTFVYYGIIEKMTVPKNLKNGVLASFQMDQLRRNFLRAEEKPAAWPMLDAEGASLSQLDIPRFEMAANSTTLGMGPNTYLDDYFIRPGVDEFFERWTALSPSDLQIQIAYIRATLSDPSDTQEKRFTAVTIPRDAAALVPDEAIEAARAIAKTIMDGAIHGDDGTVTWLTYAYNANSQFWQLHPMGLRLYDGIAGPAVFLAAIAKATGEREFADLARAALGVTSNLNAKNIETWLLSGGVGAGLGAPSMAYAQLLAGELLDDAKLKHRSLEIVRLLNESHIDADKRLDMLGGAAGCALVMSRVAAATGDPFCLEMACYAGHKLVKAMKPNNTPHRAWPTIFSKHLAGYSHGVAGIADALSRLYDTCGNEEFRIAALEGAAYENTLYQPMEKNWTNLLAEQADGTYGPWNTWCHGAPGVALGRIGMLRHIRTTELERDLAVALETCGKEELSHLDHACCGNMGRIEPLIEHFRLTGDKASLEKARKLGFQVVKRAAEKGHYTTGEETTISVPSFYQGLAGIGYQLLRLASPESFPSVLSCN